MTKVLTFGGNQTQRDLAYRVAKFCSKALKISRMEIIVWLEFKHGGMTHHLGRCRYQPCNPNFYHIDIRAKHPTIQTIVKTICHEMVHVKQIARKELYRKDGKDYYKGEQIFMKKRGTWNEPQEDEANTLEKSLADKAWKEGII